MAPRLNGFFGQFPPRKLSISLHCDLCDKRESSSALKNFFINTSTPKVVRRHHQRIRDLTSSIRQATRSQRRRNSRISSRRPTFAKARQQRQRQISHRVVSAPPSTVSGSKQNISTTHPFNLLKDTGLIGRHTESPLRKRSDLSIDSRTIVDKNEPSNHGSV